MSDSSARLYVVATPIGNLGDPSQRARETLADIAGELEDLLSFELPLSYYDDYAERVAALSPGEITATAASRVFPDRFAWVIVGDLAEVRSEIEDLGIGSVLEIDDAGNAIP